MYKEKYKSWINSNLIDLKLKKELEQLVDEKEIEDRFYKDLEFGTGGLRGVIGAGTNRMNIHTIGKATQGLADYLNSRYKGNISVSIAYDSRNMSKEFAIAAAETLCGNGIFVNLFEQLTPTPILSYAVRALKSKAGIVITASHNPKEYNGYKVYGDDGGQVTDEAASQIINCAASIKDFSKVKTMEFHKAKTNGMLTIIGENLYLSYIDKVKNLTMRKDLVKEYAKDLKIIYTPIHGSGNVPVRRVLKELGYDNVFVVKEQEMPDGNFPTAPYPNPEEPKVFELALIMAKDINPDIIFGTDPDCDRIGVVVKDKEGKYKVLTGNQTGVLLSNYILSSLSETNGLSKNGVVIKTIVTTNMVESIGKKYNVEVLDVLTGFKYIGEKIKEFENAGEKEFIFGFEESFGYLAGNFVRDKDAVIAAMLICEMTLYYKNKGMSLYDALMDIYKEHGYYEEGLVSIELAGKDGAEKIGNIIEHLRHSMNGLIGNNRIIKKMDYRAGLEVDLITNKEKIIKLPKSNVLKFVLEDGSWFVVRPSGTEPKMKIYLSVKGNSLENTYKKITELKENVMSIFDEAGIN
ncbi:phospho-sugar mutase [Clostridium sp. CM028]|uniref:phospho-sugar mutase n=1 Tax=unclassified Clostridium TaxID=2614128 RepID=UPI001C6E2AFB|nr:MULTISPECIES: phospho-sugar mutase [unclassified Clostridium]MBW9146112.1 phospho-sugar mutase [Clostridium sp. CM027]MBW9148231.1 phospho-sugar mutase [Clostridium sp. CM028]UVE41711.1 phospho-sugar mutase [Clostridium sp. CM027]WLC62342.1 phospho-sugar mutase [Clostridium sp. CM028]